MTSFVVTLEYKKSEFPFRIRNYVSCRRQKYMIQVRFLVVSCSKQKSKSSHNWLRKFYVNSGKIRNRLTCSLNRRASSGVNWAVQYLQTANSTSNSISEFLAMYHSFFKFNLPTAFFLRTVHFPIKAQKEFKY